ncbi:Gfo/Idh/MocA family protein [Caldilinea sp.]|jgi:predicted dehydrogenase|uniref:Gfo/Idh/MocA family protein n=1 Tax=Caldilinea sp. TaxID=2293560 RepID=UPI0021DD301B|nr:Gfo/Idh/MocA family oxidoreductase [Caldilinea sp.]GIV71224.1 MAG: NADH-dependent dehydrogenase [Caldilinea sp.]
MVQKTSLEKNQERLQVEPDVYSGARESAQMTFTAPDLPYRPRDPQRYRPAIGLIGCGGITAHHLAAYRSAGYNVVALCDRFRERAEERRAAFYPDAAVYTDSCELLRRDDIEVVDIATHPAERVPLIEAALLARKHVLSQKPFVLDLDVGARLCELAAKQGVQLAVNQNGRWAPHVAYLRLAVAAGLLGELTSADLSVHWDHSWVVDTPFNDIADLVLYDFAIHWFDMLTCYFGEEEPQQVFAAVNRTRQQRPRPPMLAHVLVDYPAAQATLSFNAVTKFGHHDRTYLVGTQGTAMSSGPNLQEQTVQLFTAQGVASPILKGHWFPDGFHGAMAELLCAIEEKRSPYNNAADNLRSLALAFAAIGSARDRQPKRPGEVHRLPNQNG